MFQSFAELIGRQLALEQRQEATEVALLDARQTAELRDQFIAILGHDLRNPLASVGAIGEILIRRSVSAFTSAPRSSRPTAGLSRSARRP